MPRARLHRRVAAAQPLLLRLASRLPRGGEQRGGRAGAARLRRVGQRGVRAGLLQRERALLRWRRAADDGELLPAVCGTGPLRAPPPPRRGAHAHARALRGALRRAVRLSACRRRQTARRPPAERHPAGCLQERRQRRAVRRRRRHDQLRVRRLVRAVCRQQLGVPRVDAAARVRHLPAAKRQPQLCRRAERQRLLRPARRRRPVRRRGALPATAPRVHRTGGAACER